VTADERRSARLLLVTELADGRVDAAVVDSPRMRRAVADHRGSRARRLLDGLALKAGLLGYERSVAARQDSARRAVLGEAAAGQPRVLLRVDEYPHYRAVDESARYGDDAFERFHAVLADARVPYLLAALPALASRPLDPSATGGRALSDREMVTLSRLGDEGVTLALHGYDHRTRDAHPRRRSELAGLTREELSARLDAGEAALGVPRPRVFVPPYNRFDAAQWPVLAERYDVVGGGPESVLEHGFARPPAWRGDAVWLPAYPPLYGTAAQVIPAVAALAAARRALWVPVVLHWGWEADRGLEDLRALAAKLAGLAAPWPEFLAAVEASR
jgi:peptidoglycan/xylan/chitin deacetylase (PgdA/CDA1 family)